MLCVAAWASSLGAPTAENSSSVATAAAAPVPTVAASWEHAYVFVPGKRHAVHPDSVAIDQPYPVVLYMHGCAGVTSLHDRRWARFLRGLGYIVVLPDSFARPDRKPNCDPWNHTGGAFPEAHDMRLEEIDYAAERLHRSPWADRRNIFLMGHSEGGQAAVLSYPEGFRGIILSGTYVYSDDPQSDIILAPSNTPILSLVWDHDMWSGQSLSPQANSFVRHPDSRIVIFPGSGHETYGEPEARAAVEEFLKHYTVR